MGAVSSVLLCSAPSCGVGDSDQTDNGMVRAQLCHAELRVRPGPDSPAELSRGPCEAAASRPGRAQPPPPPRRPGRRGFASPALGPPSPSRQRRAPRRALGRTSGHSRGAAAPSGRGRKREERTPRARGPFPTNIPRVQAWGTQERAPNSQGLVASGVAVVAQCEFVRLEDSRTALSIREPLIICGYLNLDLNLKTKILFSTHHISSA